MLPRSDLASTQFDQFTRCAYWIDEDPVRRHVASAGSDQTAWMQRLIRDFSGRISYVALFL